MLKSFINILFLLISTFCFAQKEASIWYFGREAGLNFNYTPVLQLNYSAMATASGCASISDVNGNLCFYTDGKTVYNSVHQIMKNGTNIGADPVVAIQSAVIVPKPYNNYIYYIFTNNPDNPWVPNKFAYTVVDMSKQGGLGEVISKNNALQYRCQKFYSTEKLTAVLHSNKSAVWVITHKCWSDSFYCYQVNANGVNPIPVISRVGTVYSPYATSLGSIKVSPDGKKLCAIMKNKGFEIFNFNNTNGTITGPIISLYDYKWYVGVEFSPDGSKLYITEYTTYLSTCKLWQLDLKAGNANQILNSKTLISTWVGSVGTGQVAIDGKIYIGGNQNGRVIQNPNLKGTACNSTSGGFNFLYGFSLGLPQFIQSYFFFPDIKTEHTCLGDSTKFSLSDTSRIYSVQWNFGDTASASNNSSTEMSPIHFYSDTGLYQVTAYVYHSGVPDTLTREIRIGLYPTASFTVNDTSQCFKANNFIFHDTSTIAVGGLSYEWNFGDSKKSFDKNPLHTYTQPGTYHSTLTVLSDYGCIATQTTHLYANPEPKASFSVSDNVLCLKDNQFRFSDSSTLSSGTLSRVWKFGDTQTDTSRFSVHNYNYADTFKAALVVSSNLGCKDSLFKQIIVRPSPVTSFSINDTNQCFKEQNYNFTNSTFVSSGNLIYHWYINKDTFTLIDIRNYKFADYGNYSARLIANTDLGCADTMDLAVKVFDSPIAGFSVNDSSQCAKGNEFHTTNFTSLASGSLMYEWDFGDGQTSTGISPTHQYLSDDTFLIKLIARSNYNCLDSVSLKAVVYPMPKAVFDVNDSSQCLSGNQFKFTNKTTINSGNLLYNWFLGDGYSVQSIHATHSYKTSDSFDVKLIATSAFSCTDSIQQKVYIHPVPKADFSINDSEQCFNNQNFIITNKSTSGSGKLTYIWYIANDSFTSTNLQLSNLKPGTFNLELRTFLDFNCPDSLTKTLIVHPSPLATFSVNDSIQCLESNSFSFTNNSVIQSGSMTFHWSIASANIISLQPINYKFSDWGKYPVRLISTSDMGCADSTESMVYVYPNPVSAFIYLNNCIEDTMWFFDKSYSDSGSVNQWYWDFKNGQTSSVQNPYRVFYDSGRKAVKLISTNNFGCSHDTTRFFRIEAHVLAPELERATVEQDEYVLIEWRPPKEGKPLTYHLEKSTDSLIWNPVSDINYTVNDYNDHQTKVDRGSYFYRLTVTDSCNFTSPYSNIGKTILLTLDSSQQFPVLSWSPYEYWSSGIERYELQIAGYSKWSDPKAKYFMPFESYVQPEIVKDSISKLSDENYCYRVVAYRQSDPLETVSNEVCIPAISHMFIPNAFTPNHDGLNDVFKPAGMYILEYKLQIFSSWGEQIFESSDMNTGWDGSFKGTDCPTDNYFYQVSAKGTGGKSMIKSGSVLLLR